MRPIRTRPTTRSSRPAPCSRRLRGSSRRGRCFPRSARSWRPCSARSPPVEIALDRARELHPLAAELVAPLLSATLSPTMIEASRKRNVIPGSCVVEVDCRLLPGQTREEIEGAPPGRRPRRLGDRVDPRGARRRHPLDARHTALARARGVGRAGRAWCPSRPDRPCRLHGQPLRPRRLRHDGVRVLPAARDGHSARGAARPLGRRAGAGRRSRGRSRSVPPRGYDLS